MNSLDVHLANEAERAQAFRNLHDVWGRGLSAEEHLRWRLGFAKHRNASWYVGCLDGRVIAGCGAYNFRLHVDGAIHEACVFGEVHTLAEFRGRGFAATLLAAAEEDQCRRGKTIAMLYSDIAPSYYERLGYVMCPSLEGWANQLGTSAAPSSALAPPLELHGCDPLQELDALVALYDRHHASLPLAVARSRAYWEYLVARSPSDEHFWLGAGGERLGYVRVIVTPVEVKIRDVAFARKDEMLAVELYAAVLRLARARGLERAGGWMPDTPSTRRHFQLVSRRTEITMLKPLVPALAIEPRHREAAAWFHEMDHV